MQAGLLLRRLRCGAGGREREQDAVAGLSTDLEPGGHELEVSLFNLSDKFQS